MKIGDIVKITKTVELDIKVGDKAQLLYQDEDGDWWADFSLNDRYEDDGKWCIENGVSECQIVTHYP